MSISRPSKTSWLLFLHTALLLWNVNQDHTHTWMITRYASKKTKDVFSSRTSSSASSASWWRFCTQRSARRSPAVYSAVQLSSPLTNTRWSTESGTARRAYSACICCKHGYNSNLKIVRSVRVLEGKVSTNTAFGFNVKLNADPPCIC